MENQEFNPLEQGMLNPNDQQIVNTKKVQSSSAEDVLGTIAKIIICLGSIICGIGAIVGLIVLMRNLAEEDDEWLIGLIILVASILTYIYTLVFWATLKMQVNMSRNLFVIKEILLKMQNKQS